MCKNELKKQLRQKIKEKKRVIDKQTLTVDSRKIFQLVEKLPEFVSAKTILAYWSLPDEVQTHDFILKWYNQKQIVLPLVKGDNLELRLFSGMNCMAEGVAFGILEPQKGEPVNEQEIDFGIIPGVAFDLCGNRMGRGKGYYDKLLKNISIYKVGVCFDFQIVEKVPTDSFDIPMDKIISSK